MTHVDYDLVVKELLKGVVPLNGELAACINVPRHSQISEFRTVGFTGARQSGKTRFVRNLALKSPDTTMIIFPESELRDQFEREWVETFGDLKKPVTWTYGFYSEHERRGRSPVIGDYPQFDTVIIDDCNRYFAKWSHAKTFKAISNVVTDDITVYLVG